MHVLVLLLGTCRKGKVRYERGTWLEIVKCRVQKIDFLAELVHSVKIPNYNIQGDMGSMYMPYNYLTNLKTLVLIKCSQSSL